MHKHMKTIILAMIFTAVLSGCAENDSGKYNVLENNKDVTVTAEPGAAGNEGNAKNEENVKNEGVVNPEEIPPYAGRPVVEINNNIPYFTEGDKKRTDAFETYSELDSLGRCKTAYANICRELMPTEERGQIGQVKPSGWKTAKYNGYIEGNYLFNRCHLIGFQLAGENANEKNLITGTRYMNCDGQLPYEDMVDKYVDKTGNHVLYRVTPVYKGDNLVASGVLTEGFSVEDGGEGLSFCVYCYNVQPGIEINYANGDSHLMEGYTGEYATTTYYSTKKVKDYGANASAGEMAGQAPADQKPEGGKYILNENSKLYHLPTCPAVGKMSEKNKKETNEPPESLEAAGYRKCRLCMGE